MKKWLRKANFRKIGDQHRNARRWLEAATAYRRHLAQHPQDAPIWVQCGHALKEAGDLQGAFSCYKEADRLAPGDPDTLLQLGHALKLQRNLIGAMASYRASADINGNEFAWMEIMSLRKSIDMMPSSLEGEVTFYSLQDMFGYLRAHATMSGIQRVQAGIASHIIKSGIHNTEFILSGLGSEYSPGSFWKLEKRDVIELIDYASGAHVSRDKLDRLISTAERRSTPVKPVSGQTIVILGAFWGHGNTVSAYISSRRDGVRIGVYIYDIIPITHPEYCDESLSRSFSTSFAEMLMVVDFILTISEYTANSVREYILSSRGRPVPIEAIPLAHSLTQDKVSQRAWPIALQHLSGRDFVAYVSTIEGRKNHLYVVKAWQELLKRGVAVPDLVFVGRRGWRISGLLDLLDVTKNLSGRIHIVHDLTDVELDTVYEKSLFTVFTSFVEGWGLPVGESLLHGTPCVASNTSSVPEVGGDFVDYVDPNNLSGGIDVLQRILEDRSYLESRRQNIRRNFVPRGWSEVAEEFVARVNVFAASPAPPESYPLLPEGVLMRPGRLVDPNIRLPNYIERPLGLIVAQSFYPPEPGGVWLRGRRGELTFDTGLSEGADIIVYLGLTAAPWASQCAVTIGLDASPRANVRNIPPAELSSRRAVMARGKVGERGVCRVLIEVLGSYEQPESDHRDFAVGLASLAYAQVSSIEARIAITEGFSFDDNLAVMDG
jgi:glycosyltransferase involved in cell wall biosynthesis